MAGVVTGAAGFLGRQLVSALAAAGETPLAVDLRGASLEPGVRFLEADLRRPGALDAHLEAGDVVFHLAGRASVGASVTDPLGDYEAQLRTLLEVLESARRVEARVVFASSAAVFGEAGERPLPEDAPHRPRSPYGAAKAAGEAYANAYAASYGLDVRIARLFSAYGAGMPGFAIRDFHARLREQPDRLVLRGDGLQVRDYLHVEDVATAFRRIAERGEAGEAYNVGSGEPVEIRDLAARVAGVMGLRDVRIVADGRAVPGDIPVLVADTRKLRSLGFQPRVSLPDGLGRTVRWLAERRT